MEAGENCFAIPGQAQDISAGETLVTEHVPEDLAHHEDHGFDSAEEDGEDRPAITGNNGIAYHGAVPLHIMVRNIIADTPAGSKRAMSAGYMVQLVTEMGLPELMAKRLFSQIRAGAPLHDEWKQAFEEERFEQRLGRTANSNGRAKAKYSSSRERSKKAHKGGLPFKEEVEVSAMLLSLIGGSAVHAPRAVPSSAQEAPVPSANDIGAGAPGPTGNESGNSSGAEPVSGASQHADSLGTPEFVAQPPAAGAASAYGPSHDNEHRNGVYYDAKGNPRLAYHGAAPLHIMVRNIIADTPAGSKRAMSAGYMVQLVTEMGLPELMAKRLFSQIRRGAPLHDEWKQAFEEERFEQRLGRCPHHAGLPRAAGRPTPKKARPRDSSLDAPRACVGAMEAGCLTSSEKDAEAGAVLLSLFGGAAPAPPPPVPSPNAESPAKKQHLPSSEQQGAPLSPPPVNDAGTGALGPLGCEAGLSSVAEPDALQHASPPADGQLAEPTALETAAPESPPPVPMALASVNPWHQAPSGQPSSLHLAPGMALGMAPAGGGRYMFSPSPMGWPFMSPSPALFYFSGMPHAAAHASQPILDPALAPSQPATQLATQPATQPPPRSTVKSHHAV